MEDEWLHQLVGEWTWTSDTQPNTGTESVRSLGGSWIVVERVGDTPGGTSSTSIVTLGYSAEKNKYVGTFVASAMSDLWRYEGFVDRNANALVLDTEGPGFVDPSRRGRYKDTIRIIDKENRVMTSTYQSESGEWLELMTLRYRSRGS